MKIFPILSIFFCLPIGLFAKDIDRSNIDSLMNLINSDIADTEKVDYMNAIAWELKNSGNFSESLIYSDQSLTLAEKIGYKRGMARALNNKGVVYMKEGNYQAALRNHFASLKISAETGNLNGMASSNHNIGNINSKQGKFKEALDYYTLALKLRRAIGNKGDIASTLNSIGLIYSSTGNYSGAIKNHLEALKINEALRDKQGMAFSDNNIGQIYHVQGNLPLALHYYFSSLKLLDDIGDIQNITNCYNNIGSVYMDQKNYNEALKNFELALKIDKETGNKRGMESSYGNIGIVYNLQNNYAGALEKYNMALKISEEVGDDGSIANCYLNIGNTLCNLNKFSDALSSYSESLKFSEKSGDKQLMANCFLNIGDLFRLKKEYTKAKSNLQKALYLSKELGNKKEISDCYVNITELDSALGNWKSAYENHKMYLVYRDSLLNDDNTRKTVQLQMEYEFDKKEAITKADQDKKDLLTNAEIKRQTLIKNSTVGGVGVVGLFSFLLVLSVNRRRKTAFDKQVSDVEMKALRAQMNPHFIFNCMNSIDDYILNNDINNSSLYVNKFSRLMRLILESSRKDEVTIKEDLETLELYVQLENLRMQNSVECKFTISPEINVEDTLIPPMLLQPFIENAFKHAFDEIEHPKLEIQISLKDEMLHCSVIDNGKGRNKEQKLITEGKEKRKSLGMTVTQERLDIISKIKKCKAYMAFEDLKDSYQKAAGTKVKLAIPVSFAF